MTISEEELRTVETCQPKLVQKIVLFSQRNSSTKIGLLNQCCNFQKILLWLVDMTHFLQTSHVAFTAVNDWELKVYCDLLCCHSYNSFSRHGFIPHDYVCEVQLYRSWTGARANWISSPNVPSSVLLSLSWRHNVITWWCPLFSTLLSWCCVHEFINGTLWLVIHKHAAEAELVQYESFMMRSGWIDSYSTWAATKFFVKQVHCNWVMDFT